MSAETWINFGAPALLVAIGLAAAWLNGVVTRREQAAIDRSIAAE
jgi:hypothetical protein